MKKRDPFQQALATLMASAADGRFAWGEPLVVTALAQELGLSPTPVREALARLSGEGLIDHRPGRGYFASSPSVEDVVDLLEYHRRLVHWALDLIEQATIRPPLGPIDGTSGERVFVAIVRASERSVIVRGHWRTTLQLRPIRKLQIRMSASDAEWTRRVQPLLLACDISAIRREVDLHHHDSANAASAVINEMRRAAESIVQI